MAANPEQSQHWDARQNLPLLSEGFHPCWPCREGLPRYPWRSNDGKALFEVVTAWGLRTEAWIDDTQEFMSEGVEWVIVDGRRRRNVKLMQIAAWRRIPGRSVPHPPRSTSPGAAPAV